MIKRLIKKIRYKCIYTLVLMSLQGKGIHYAHSKVMAQQIAYFRVYG